MFILPNNENSKCSACEVIDCPALAMAYVPSQRFNTTYPPESALCKGTLFPELDKPFCGRTVMMGGCRRG